MIGLYIYSKSCPYSTKYLPIWNSYASAERFPCNAIEISKKYDGINIVDAINSLREQVIVDTKPSILFFDIKNKKIYLYVKRPVTVESLKEAADCIKNSNKSKACRIISATHIRLDRRKTVDRHEKDRNTLFVF